MARYADSAHGCAQVHKPSLVSYDAHPLTAERTSVRMSLVFFGGSKLGVSQQFFKAHIFTI